MTEHIGWGALACASAAVAVAVLAAALVRVGGRGAEVRQAMRLPLAGWPRDLRAALEIAVHNGRLVLGVLACAHAAPRVAPWLRRGLDSALGVILVQNAAFVGAALGAYGWPLAAILALHLPFELAAVSLAGGVYLSGRRTELPGARLLVPGACCCVLLVAGGLLETFTPLEAGS